MICKQDIQNWFNQPFDLTKAIYLLGGSGRDTRQYVRYLSASYVPDWAQHSIINELTKVWQELPEGETTSTQISKQIVHSTRAVRLLKERSQIHALMRLYAENNQPQQAYEAAERVLALSTEINEIYGTDYYNQLDLSPEEAAERAIVLDTIKKVKAQQRLAARIRKYKQRKMDATLLVKELKIIENELGI